MVRLDQRRSGQISSTSDAGSLRTGESYTIWAGSVCFLVAVKIAVSCYMMMFIR